LSARADRAVGNPLPLWRAFDQFAPDTIAAMPTWEENSHAGSVCSCAILLNFALFRQPYAPFMPSSLLPSSLNSSITVGTFASATVDGVPALIDPVDLTNRVPWDPLSPHFSDQGVLHVLWTYLRPRFVRLRQNWDVSFCGRWYDADPAAGADADDDDEHTVLAAQLVREEMRSQDDLSCPDSYICA
jgi:hypothetical protein